MKLRAWLAAIGAVALMAGAGCAVAPVIDHGTVVGKSYKPDQSFPMVMPNGSGGTYVMWMADPAQWLITIELCEPECVQETLSVNAATWEPINVGDQYGESGTQ